MSNLYLKKILILPIFAVFISILAFLPVHASTNAGNIAIRSNADFASCSCVSGGDGSSSNPYVISGLLLISQNGPGILVDNSQGKITKYFVITADTINGGNGPATNYPGIEFISVNGLGKITGAKNTINGNQYGVLLVNSYNILIDGVSNSNGATINNNGVDGVAIVGGGSNTISNIQVNHNGIGIPEDFVTGGVGITLNSTSNNVIKNVVLSEDAMAGLTLFGSSSNLISGISVHYPDFYAAIIDGGTGNTLSGNTLQTGDYLGLWLRDSTSGNQILSNNISSNGPTGKETTDGIAPYFTSGLYISSGASNNVVKNNILLADSGSSIIQDNGNIVNGITKPIQNNNLFNDPTSGNEPVSPVFPSGPAGTGNTFCGNTVKTMQGVLANPIC